jgi:predicted protein tyrosine phosphatase
VVLPFKITVCGFAELERCCGLGVSHVLSLLDPKAPAPPELALLGGARRLELRFDDVIEKNRGVRLPALADAAAILALGRELNHRRAAHRHLLLHCHAGFSRSPAALALLIAQALPQLPADLIAAEVLRIRPNAWPNLRVIELGDRLLAMDGELVEAAALIYQKRLGEDPRLATIMRENNRERELQTAAGREFRARRAALT